MSLQIFILGRLHEQDYHPYDIKKSINNAGENLVRVTDGNLYYNFEALQKKGYVQKVNTVQNDNRPEKTNYAITEKGKQALKDMIYKSFKNADDVRSLFASLLFVHLVDTNKLIYSTLEVIENIEKELAYLEANADHPLPEYISPEQQEMALFMKGYKSEKQKVELKSFKKLLSLLEQKQS